MPPIRREGRHVLHRVALGEQRHLAARCLHRGDPRAATLRLHRQREVGTVGRPHVLARRALGSHPPLTRSVRRHEVQRVVSRPVGEEGDLLARRAPLRRDVFTVEGGEPVQLRAVRADAEDLRIALAAGGEGDPLTIRGPARVEVARLGVGQPAHRHLAFRRGEIRHIEIGELLVPGLEGELRPVGGEDRLPRTHRPRTDLAQGEVRKGPDHELLDVTFTLADGRHAREEPPVPRRGHHHRVHPLRHRQHPEAGTVRTHHVGNLPVVDLADEGDEAGKALALLVGQPGAVVRGRDLHLRRLGHRVVRPIGGGRRHLCLGRGFPSPAAGARADHHQPEAGQARERGDARPPEGARAPDVTIRTLISEHGRHQQSRRGRWRPSGRRRSCSSPR